MSKTTNKFSPEVRARAVRMILDHQGDYPSRWSAVVSIAEKIGCVPQTLHVQVQPPLLPLQRFPLAPRYSWRGGGPDLRRALFRRLDAPYMEWVSVLTG